jgi:chromosome segregation ATPase
MPHDPMADRLSADVRHLQDTVHHLREYKRRADYELRTYQEEFGILRQLRERRGDGLSEEEEEPDPSLLAPLLVAYDRRIQCLEAELQARDAAARAPHPSQDQLSGLESDLRRATEEADRLRAQIARDAERARSTEATYLNVARAAEAESSRLKVVLEENRMLRDAQQNLTAALDKLSERIRGLEGDTQTGERSKAMLQAAVTALQQKEAALTRRLAEASADNERLRAEAAQRVQQAERDRLALQRLQQTEATAAAAHTHALEELDALRRENRSLQKEVESGRASIQTLQQTEYEILRKLKEAFEEMEECKGDLSTGLAREGQKDAQLAGLRDQMRQLLAVQTETHNKHLKVVAAKHRAHVEELAEELKAKELEVSALKAQVEKSAWEKKQKERELEVLRRDPQPIGWSLGTTATDDGASRLQAATLERDELQRRLDQEAHRHRREEREWELQSGQLRHQLLEKERRSAVFEAQCGDLRDEIAQLQKEIERLQKQTQALRLQKEETERKVDHESGALATRFKLQEERLQLQVQEAVAKQKAAEQALDRAVEQRADRERQLRGELQHERERLGRQMAEGRSETMELERRVKELTAALAQAQAAAKDREREAESAGIRSEQLARNLEVHKEQLGRTTAKLATLVEREATHRRDLKDCQLQLDRAQLECERMERDRDRCRGELLEVRGLLQGAAAAAHPRLETHTVGWNALLGTAAAAASRKTRRPRRPAAPLTPSSVDCVC